MKKIIIGCFMIFVNIYFYLGDSIIGLIPDFAGFILISNGIRECIEDTAEYRKIQKIAFAACIYSAVLWIMDLAAVTSKLYVYVGAWCGYILRLNSIIFIGIVTYMLTEIFKSVEGKYNYAIDLRVLKLSWFFVIVINFVMLICSNIGAVYSWLALGEILAAMWFLIMLYLAFEKAFEVSKGKKI